jgi:putative oxidoreductase
MLHGMQKMVGYPPMDQPRPELFSLLGLAGVLELFGGGLLVLGLFSQPVAAILSLEMAIAYALVHLPQGVLPILNGGEPAYLFGLIFLYIAFAGGGAWSMDRALRTVDEAATVAG